MDFGWLKRMMPRGLYGRAALILLVPIVTLQIVVSGQILQRYFRDVAAQMTTALVLDLALVRDQIASGGPAEDTALALQITIAPAAEGLTADRRLVYDLTGIEAIRVLRRDLPDLVAVDLMTDERFPVVALRAGDEIVALSVPRRRMSASNPHQLLVLMVFFGLFMTWVAYIFLRNQLKPIRRLALASEAFGKGQVVEYHPSGATEVRSAGRAFLDMRGRIEAMLEQRTLMLSGVSHDLRTPLTRMKLGLSILDQDADVAALLRDVEEMEALLATFLDFARGEALDDPVLTDPVTLADQIVADAKRIGGQISLTAPDLSEPVLLRPQAVRRCLSNLVSNALRYGVHARLTVVLADRAIRFTVEDDGPGIPPERRAEALKPFARLDAARNQDKGSGVGLGLAIARDIAQRHGGSLSLRDSADLGGLRVDLVLPR
ncbi:ATP-binding protein [Roseicyclus mahoneyensis]|uniref:histidine kinase n=1 Tax=Roseicyclus mahoneyensis TaxID=164332 RepID=A0A316H5S7_9RHOB|nr:ATP-binding protein [Roseicyclus mahoneyensis]PWK62923.1 two-component system osmolarity sensor histidine kinase EnvZ [Roseicyclus mahoneyensis]